VKPKISKNFLRRLAWLLTVFLMINRPMQVNNFGEAISTVFCYKTPTYGDFKL
jgi:hypothetical protein